MNPLHQLHPLHTPRDKQYALTAIRKAHDGNAIATQLARLELAGQSLTQTADGYVLSRWTYSKHCADMDAVEHLLGRVDGLSAKEVTAE